MTVEAMTVEAMTVETRRVVPASPPMHLLVRRMAACERLMAETVRHGLREGAGERAVR